MSKFFPIAAFLFLCTACAPALAEINRTDMVLGTVCTIRLLEGGSTKTTDEIFARLKQIEDRMSVNKEGTELAAVNAAAGKTAVKVSNDTFFVISKALDYARLTDGAFDPTVGPLVKLWGIGTDNARVPSKSEIASTLVLIGYRNVELDKAARTIKLLRSGMRLDLGAIAKGYAADECSRILEAHKVKSAIVDLGGNVLVYGKKKDGSLWKVGVQDPSSDRGEYIGIVTGPSMTIVTSGVYERYFMQDGIRYHHLLDTKTGFPIQNGLTSVSIITDSSIDADGLSTSVFALGLEKGKKLVESLPGVKAVFIDSNQKVYLSGGADKVFTITNKTFSLAK
ncbi:MAG: FAD:protein FMN transferase [Spirochaetes bacterium]|nr:FAD:protein FMN transferase [Spirochaetota bacterium]